MATPRKVTLTVDNPKSAAVIAAGSTANGNVIVEFDADDQEGDIIATLLRAVEVIREQEMSVGG